MRRFWHSPAGVNWRAAALLGLVSSTFSTLVSTVTAARIGRDAAVDWMVVAVIPMRDPALQTDPSWAVIAAGILFHQWADFSWAVVFFGLLGRWTAGLGPLAILAVAGPWALFTSALEYFCLVPAIPFRQPIFTLEQPYWIGLLVHMTSASLYPLFPWLRDRVAGRSPSPNRTVAVVWSGLAAAGLCLLGALALLGATGRELPWMGHDQAFDQGYMRRMKAHHTQGIEIARLGADRADDPHLRALARLMAAAQAGENAVFDQWWSSWFGPISMVCTPEERGAMPGMLTPDEVQGLKEAASGAFDPLFVRLMTRHHEGAIAMTEEALHSAGDIRLKLMAHGIRQEQRGEIELMHGIAPGWPTVEAAFSALVAPAGQGLTERRYDPP